MQTDGEEVNLMPPLRIFTDGSVNPKSKVGFGAYLAVPPGIPYSEALKAKVKVKRFEHTSSAKLEIQTLIWALTSIQEPAGRIIVHTDSQNIIGLPARRERLERNKYLSNKKTPIKNRDLYQEFFRLSDQLDCEFVKVRGHKASRHKDALDTVFSLVDRASRKALRHENRDGAT